jgi:hypothetical protein
VESQQAVVQRLHHGSRPEEIPQAQANVASAKSDLVNASQQWNRMMALSKLTTGSLGFRVRGITSLPTIPEIGCQTRTRTKTSGLLRLA